MIWNFDIASAPRGKYALRAAPKGRGHIKSFEPEKVILALECGTVTVSRYLPDEKRWEMLCAGQRPLAWAPYRTREITDERGRVRTVADLPPHPTKATSWFQDRLAEQRNAA